MHDLLDFDAVSPDSWIRKENEYREKLMKLTDLTQVCVVFIPIHFYFGERIIIK